MQKLKMLDEKESPSIVDLFRANADWKKHCNPVRPHGWNPNDSFQIPDLVTAVALIAESAFALEKKRVNARIARDENEEAIVMEGKKRPDGYDGDKENYTIGYRVEVDTVADDDTKAESTLFVIDKFNPEVFYNIVNAALQTLG